MKASNPSRREYLALCGSVSLAGCSATLGGGTQSASFGWRGVASDPANTGFVDEALALAGSRRAWEVELPGRPRTSPVATPETVFVGTTTGTKALSVETGSQHWHVGGPGVPAATPGVGDGVLVVPSVRRTPSNRADETVVRAVDVASGEERWSRTVRLENLLPPTVTDDHIVVRGGSSVLSLSPDDGSVEWRVDGLDPFEEAWDVTKDLAPAVSDGTVFAPEPRGVTAVELETGEPGWKLDARKVRAAPSAVDGTLFVADAATGLRAVDAATGRPRWSWSGSGCWTSPTVTGDAVYLTAGFDVVALDPSDGTELWRTGGSGLRADSFSSVAASERRLAACSGDVAARVYDVADVETGEVRRAWEHAGSGTVFSPALASGRVLAVDGTTLLAFGGG